MTDFSAIQAQRHQEAEIKRHTAEMKKLKRKNAREYRKEVDHHKDLLTQMRKTYDDKVSRLETELEKKLVKVRNQHDRIMSEEKQRLAEELHNLKAAHEDRVSELKLTHMNEIEQMNKSHRRTLDNARERFNKEKLKWEA